MCENDYISTVLFFISASILFVIGIPSFIVGSIRPQYYKSNILTSIPIYPTTDDGFLYWIGKIPIENQTYYLKESFSSFDINIYKSDFDPQETKYTFFLIHNVFGLDIDIEFQLLKNNIPLRKFTKKMNENYGQINENNINYIYPRELPEDLTHFGDFQIYCPYKTLITDYNRISKKCSIKGGYFMNLIDKLNILKIGELEINDIIIKFNKLIIIPKDFIEIPQIYIGAWSNSDSFELIIAGSILTILGLIFLFIGIIIYCIYLFNLP